MPWLQEINRWVFNILGLLIVRRVELVWIHRGHIIFEPAGV